MFIDLFFSEQRLALSTQLTQRMAQIIQYVGQNISHVKALTTKEVISFPFKVQIILIILSRHNKTKYKCIISSTCSLTFPILVHNVSDWRIYRKIDSIKHSS
jgi:hypothetical protein